MNAEIDRKKHHYFITSAEGTDEDIRLRQEELKAMIERFSDYFKSATTRSLKWLVLNATLIGLMPFALLEGYRFWRTGPTSMRGYPVSPTRLKYHRGFKGGREALIDRLRSIRWSAGTYLLVDYIGRVQVSISRRALPTEIEIAEGNTLAIYDDNNQHLTEEEREK